MPCCACNLFVVTAVCCFPACCCSNCSFVGNNASYSGVFAASGSAVINISTSTFADNSVVNNGAVMIIGDEAQVRVHIMEFCVYFQKHTLLHDQQLTLGISHVWNL
jgi:hypothetical protein